MLKPICAFLLALAVPVLASAQILINDFSDGSANASFLGWSGQQNAGTYGFTGTDDDASGVEYAQALDLAASSALELTARIDSLDNTAASFVVALFNDSGESATATFLTSAFSTSGFTTVRSNLTLSSGFDPALVTFYRISGGVFLGFDQVALTADNLAAVSAIPEPSTYALMAGVAGLGLAIYRRRRRTA